MPTNKLSDSEAAMIKGIKKHRSGMSNQDILARFSVPSRTINGGRISEIKNGHDKYKGIDPCEKKEVDKFLKGEIRLTDLMRKGTPSLFSSSVIGKEKIFDNIIVDINKLVVLKNESESVEFKEFYEKESIPTYAKILAGMVNSGFAGSIIFGIDDNLKIVGIDARKKIVISEIQKIIKDHFEPYIVTELHSAFVIKKKLFQLKIKEIQSSLPVICKKDKTIKLDKKDKHLVEDGAIYYRYGSDTNKIRHAELSMIIRKMSGN